jgi:hypothetical protein
MVGFGEPKQTKRNFLEVKLTMPQFKDKYPNGIPLDDLLKLFEYNGQTADSSEIISVMRSLQYSFNETSETFTKS